MPDENVESALDDLQELYGLLRTYPEFKQDRRLRGAFAALVKAGHLRDESTRPAPAAIPSAEKAPEPYFPQTTLDPRVPVTMPNLLGSQAPISTLPTTASTDLTPRGKTRQRLRGPVTPNIIQAPHLSPYRERDIPDPSPKVADYLSQPQKDPLRLGRKLTPEEDFQYALSKLDPISAALADVLVNQNPVVISSVLALNQLDPIEARKILSRMEQVGEKSGPLGAIVSGVAESVIPGAIGLKAYSLGARAAAAAALKGVARSALRPGIQGAIGMGAGVVGGLGAATVGGNVAQKAITQTEKFIYGDVYPQVQALRAQRQSAHKGAYQLGVAGSALLYASPSAADIRIMGKLVPDMIRRLRTNAAQRAIEAKASGIRGVLSLDAPTPREVREAFSALRQTAGWSTIGTIQRERLMEGMIEIVGEGGRVLETGQPFDVSDALLNFFFGYIAPGENALGKAVLHAGPKANIGKVLEGRKTQSVDARARAAERAWEEVVAAYNPPVRRPVAPAAATTSADTSTGAVDANAIPAEPVAAPTDAPVSWPALDATPAAVPEPSIIPEPVAAPETTPGAESPSVRLSPIAAWAESLRQVQESTLSPADRVVSLANSAAQVHIQMLSMGMDPAQIDETMQRIFTSVVTNGIRGNDRKSPSKAFMDTYQQAVDTFKANGATQGDSWLQMTPEEEAEAAFAAGPGPRPLPEEDEQNRDLITGKLFWDLTFDEMLAAHEFAKKQDVEIPKSILGDKYKRWAYLWRRVSAEYNRPTFEEEKKYDDEIKEIESQLSEEDRDRLYNYGGLGQDVTKYTVGDLRLLETSESPLEMGQILARLMEENSYPKDGKLDLNRPGHQFLLTYFNNANRVAQKKGWDITDVFRKAIIRLAQRRGKHAEELMGDLLRSMGITPEEIRNQPIDPFQLESANIDSEVDYGQHNKPEPMQISAEPVGQAVPGEELGVVQPAGEQPAGPVTQEKPLTAQEKKQQKERIAKDKKNTEQVRNNISRALNKIPEEILDKIDKLGDEVKDALGLLRIPSWIEIQKSSVFESTFNEVVHELRKIGGQEDVIAHIAQSVRDAIEGTEFSPEEIFKRYGSIPSPTPGIKNETIREPVTLARKNLAKVTISAGNKETIAARIKEIVENVLHDPDSPDGFFTELLEYLSSNSISATGIREKIASGINKYIQSERDKVDAQNKKIEKKNSEIFERQEALRREGEIDAANELGKEISEFLEAADKKEIEEDLWGPFRSAFEDEGFVLSDSENSPAFTLQSFTPEGGDVTDAVSEQGADAGVLRQSGPEVGLPQVVEGNAEQGESAGAQTPEGGNLPTTSETTGKNVNTSAFGPDKKDRRYFYGEFQGRKFATDMKLFLFDDTLHDSVQGYAPQDRTLEFRNEEGKATFFKGLEGKKEVLSTSTTDGENVLLVDKDGNRFYINKRYVDTILRNGFHIAKMVKGTSPNFAIVDNKGELQGAVSSHVFNGEIPSFELGEDASSQKKRVVVPYKAPGTRTSKKANSTTVTTTAKTEGQASAIPAAPVPDIDEQDRETVPSVHTVLERAMDDPDLRAAAAGVGNSRIEIDPITDGKPYMDLRSALAHFARKTGIFVKRSDPKHPFSRAYGGLYSPKFSRAIFTKLGGVDAVAHEIAHVIHDAYRVAVDLVNAPPVMKGSITRVMAAELFPFSQGALASKRRMTPANLTFADDGSFVDTPAQILAGSRLDRREANARTMNTPQGQRELTGPWTIEMEPKVGQGGYRYFVVTKESGDREEVADFDKAKERIADLRNDVDDLDILYQRSEGFAEWVRAWMINPDAAIAAAPTIYDNFKVSVPLNVIDALRELGDNIRRGQGAAEAGGKPLVQKAMTQIVGLPKKYQFINHLRALIYAHRMEREWRTSFMDRIVNRYWRDRFDPANKLLRRVMATTRQAPLETLAGMSFEDWKELPEGTTIIDPSKDPIQQLADLNYVENKFKAIAEHGMINEAGEVIPGTEGGFLAGLAKLQSLAPKTMQELHDHFAHAMLYGLARRTLNVSAIARNRSAAEIAKVHAEIDSRVKRIFAKLDKDEERARRDYQEKMRHAVIGVVEADRMSREREIINRAINALDPKTGDPAKILQDALASGKITQQQFWSWSKNPINYVKNAVVGDEIKTMGKAYVALRAEAIERVRQIMDPAMARNPIKATGLDNSVRDIVEGAILREEDRAKNGLQVLRQKFDRQRTRVLQVADKAKQRRIDPIQQRLGERLHYMMGFAEGTDFTDEEIAHKVLDELNKDPNVAKVYEDLHDWMIHWSNSVLHYAFERGRITQEQYSRLLTDNYWYMPIRREMSGQGMGEEVYYDEAVQSMLDSAAGVTQGKDFSRNNRHADTLIVRPVVKEFKGDTRQILNPFTTLIENTHAIVKEADRNAIFASIDRLVRGGRKAMHSQMDPHPQFGIWITAVPSQHEATKGIEYFVEGKKHYIHFEDKYVEEALRGAGKLHFPSAVESAFRFITHIQRSNIVSSLRYLLTNKIRDVPEAAIKSPFAGKSGARAKTSQGAQRGTPGKQVNDLAKYWTVRTTPEMDRLYELYGGGTSALEDLAMGSRMRAGQSPYARSLDAFLDKAYQGERTLLHKVRRGVKFIFVTAPMHVREKAEESTRAQEYRLAKEFADAYGYSEHEANTFAMRQARMLLDHQRGGLATKEIGKYVVFFNAHFQGVASNVDRANALWGRGDKIQAAKMLRRLLWRAIFLSGTMEILTRLWTRHVWGEEETKEHASFPPWARDNFYLIKAGHDLWLSVAKSHELSLPASFFFRFIEAIRTGDWQDAFYGFPETVIKNLLPGRGYGTLAGSAEPFMSLYYNMDSETGKTIVDPWEMGADLSLRTGQDKASNLARWASSLYNRVPGLPEVDPRQADYLLNSYFGDTYRMTSGALNINRDDEQKTTLAQMMQRMTGLMREGPGEASQQGMQAQELIKKGSMESRHILMDPYQKLSNVRRKAAESEPWWRWGNKDLAEAKREFRQHAGDRVPAMKLFEDQMERGAQMFANLKKMNIADARREFRADPSIAPHLINFGRAASAAQIQRATVAIRTALDRKEKELPPVKKSNYGPANLGILLGKDLPPRRMPR